MVRTTRSSINLANKNNGSVVGVVFAMYNHSLQYEESYIYGGCLFGIVEVIQEWEELEKFVF